MTAPRIWFVLGWDDFNPHLPYGRWRLLIWSATFMGYFNPHLPYGRWLTSDTTAQRLYQFQSTPSLRKVTINPQSLSLYKLISIHTFLTEGDRSRSTWHRGRLDFNPHLPYGRWLHNAWEGVRKRLISIHTFLTEGDITPFAKTHIILRFQSTPSLRKVTAKISIIKFL